MKIRNIGSILIGILTHIMGYPIFTTEGFSSKNLIILIIIETIWLLLIDLINLKGE